MSTGRRRFLAYLTTFVAGIGVAFASVPFIRSWLPNASTNERRHFFVNIQKLKPGQIMAAHSPWGQSYYILHRTPEMLEALEVLNDDLADPTSLESIQPDYARNATRSLKPELFVASSNCTHLGCDTSYRPPTSDSKYPHPWDGSGSFVCPCHGSRFDLAGRVAKAMPAQTNLVIPNYSFEKNMLEIHLK